MLISLSENKPYKGSNQYPSIDTQPNRIVKEVFTKFILCNNVCIHNKILEHNLFDKRFGLWKTLTYGLKICPSFIQLDEIATCQVIHSESTVQQLWQRDITGSSKVEAINDLFINHKKIITGNLRSRIESMKLIKSIEYTYTSQDKTNKFG